MSTQHELVTRQFGSTAAAYAKSSTHNDAASLAQVVEIVAPLPHEEALDIATGPGTVALALAPLVKRAVALDLTPSMLEQTRKQASERGLTNVETVESPAENLPFGDASFDIVTVRTAPHHYADIRAALSEMARVVKPSGRVLIVDTTSPEDPDLSRELNDIEKMRDPSHVHNYTPTEWKQMIEEVGLRVEFEQVHTHAFGKRLWFNEWTQRMNVPAETVEVLRDKFLNGPEGLKKLMEIEEQGEEISFTLPEITILARPAPR